MLKAQLAKGLDLDIGGKNHSDLLPSAPAAPVFATQPSFTA